MEHKIDDILQGAFAEMRREKPQRELVLHTEPGRPVRRPVVIRWAAAVAAVAAVLVVSLVIFIPERSQADDFVCYVNGTRIVDRDVALQHTRDALGIAGAGVGKTMERVDEIFNKINQTY